LTEVGFIEHRGARILRIEFPAEAEPAKMTAIMDEAGGIITRQPLNTVLTLTIIGDFHFDTEVAKHFEEYVKRNKPHVKAGAVIGLHGLKKSIYNALMFLSRRQLKVCADIDEALDYLGSIA